MNEPRPNKNLGQHWLYDRAVLEAICAEAELLATDTVLEVGPGLGTLTQILTQQVQKVVAVEFDRQLAAELPKRVPAKNLEVITADILAFDFTQLPPGYKVVANVPYYITSKITRNLLESANPPQSATLLVQKEVAQRMAAAPGDMSILAIAVQLYSEVRLGMIVPAALFTPPPQVDSQVITLIRRNQPLFSDIDQSLFFRIVRAGFGEKRKKLRNSLSGGLHMEKSDVESWLQRAAISLDVRAEQLSLDDWYKLSKQFS